MDIKMKSYEDEITPLTKEELAWVKKLERVLLSCPSDRLALVTIGDACLDVIDYDFVMDNNLEICDGQAMDQGLVFAMIRSKPKVLGVSG